MLLNPLCQSCQKVDKAHMTITIDQIQTLSQEAGFDDFGLVRLPPRDFAAAPDWWRDSVERFETWLSSGRASEMTWLAQTRDLRRSPRKLLWPADQDDLGGPAYAFCGVIQARAPLPEKPNQIGHVFGRTGTTAHGRDYHNVARTALRKLRRGLLELTGPSRMYASSDQGPLLERALAFHAGLGQFGLNGCLFHPRFGSFFHLASLLFPGEVEGFKEPELTQNHCGNCNRCVQNCPAGALSANGLDARRCLSFWTVEHRGELPEIIERKLGDRVFGCDTCQEVCPQNIHREVDREKLENRWKPVPERIWPDLEELAHGELDISGSALQRAGLEGLQRNALIAWTNIVLSGQRETANQLEVTLQNALQTPLAATAKRQLLRLHSCQL